MRPVMGEGQKGCSGYQKEEVKEQGSFSATTRRWRVARESKARKRKVEFLYLSKNIKIHYICFTSLLLK